MFQISRRRANLIAAILAAAAVLLVACDDEATPESTATAEATTATPAGAETRAAGALSAEQIYMRVALSIAFVETPIAIGSAVLIDDRRLVTNAHVVWPFEQVRVVFADGSEYPDSAVIGWDMMLDLAVIELDSAVTFPPLSLSEGELPPVGSDVFLVGYPTEGERFPQPAISRGILSRFREWERPGIGYSQTDASVEGGQSGGALVSATGEIIGISGFSLGTGNFALATFASDVQLRLDALLRGVDVSGLGDRRLPRSSGQRKHSFALQNYYHEQAFLVFGEPGATVTIEVDGVQDAFLRAIDLDGLIALDEVDESGSGVERGEFRIELAAPSIAIVGQLHVTPGAFSITASAALTPLIDPDDGRRVGAGSTTIGSLDYLGDVDVFEIDLVRGQSIVVTVDTTNFDPVVVIDAPWNDGEEFAFDDDSGRGIFGVNARVAFTADRGGRYLIVVSDPAATDVGGYYLVVE